ncbi:regulator of Vps4 activity in the MVB pathway-domain-containing protein [Tribonema minus]|uniref:Regulator of Vps4 activity in the MVB pathway-domain-containing protein n=1 Tax=Tribonema minus TaxID=303371 RepID=A0A836CJV4_9STRA|nr:regulator of Vps4 activity in the MVB pathway-domain-containing protein [Tribonema minus]
MTSILKAVGIGFDGPKTKAYLKMSMQRLQMHINKKTNSVEMCKREVARLLGEGKEDKARIRVEQIIRDDATRGAYEILELQCDLLVQRMRYIESQSTLPTDLLEAISTIIWAADRTEAEELSKVKDQFAKKYGRETMQRAMRNEIEMYGRETVQRAMRNECGCMNPKYGCVNPKVAEQLSVEPPSNFLVQSYLVEIAKEFSVDWKPAAEAVDLRTGLTSSAMAAKQAASSQVFASERQQGMPVEAQLAAAADCGAAEEDAEAETEALRTKNVPQPQRALAAPQRRQAAAYAPPASELQQQPQQQQQYQPQYEQQYQPQYQQPQQQQQQQEGNGANAGYLPQQGSAYLGTAAGYPTHQLGPVHPRPASGREVPMDEPMAPPAKEAYSLPSQGLNGDADGGMSPPAEGKIVQEGTLHFTSGRSAE